MKIKVIKKMLSVFLTISSLAAATFCASAEDGDQLYFETKIAECDEIIYECNKTIKNFEKEKDRNIESVKNDLKTLEEIKRMLKKGEVLDCDSQDLEVKSHDFLKKIKDIKKDYRNNIKPACEIIQQQINQKTEYEKKLNELKKLNKNSFDLFKQIQSFREKFVNSSSNRDKNLANDIMNFEKKVDKIYQDGQLSEENINKLKNEFENLKAKVGSPNQNQKNINKPTKEFENLKAKVGSPNQNRKNINKITKEFENLKAKVGSPNQNRKNINKVTKEFENLKAKVGSPNQNRKNINKITKKLAEPSKKEKLLNENLFNLVRQVQNLREEYMNSSSNSDENLTNEIMNFESKVDKLYQDGQLSEENINQLKREFDNLLIEAHGTDQNRTNLNLWKKIHSGAQCYKPDHIASNLCWLHSATNVQNYYNNANNKDVVKGQKAIVQKYKTIMGEQAFKANIDGNPKEIEHITKYLQKCGFKTFDMNICGEPDKKAMDTAKKLLKAHFTKKANPSPVISYEGGLLGHFVTIADYYPNTDTFLIIDSYSQEADAKFKLKKELPVVRAFGKSVINLIFASNSEHANSQSWTFMAQQNDKITQSNAHLDKEFSVSIDALKNMTQYY